jgi:hypothetical protein
MFSIQAFGTNRPQGHHCNVSLYPCHLSWFSVPAFRSGIAIRNVDIRRNLWLNSLNMSFSDFPRMALGLVLTVTTAVATGSFPVSVRIGRSETTGELRQSGFLRSRQPQLRCA